MRAHFRPEFLNRIDEFITFKGLTLADIKRIVVLQAKRVEERLEAKKMHMKLDESAIEYLAVSTTCLVCNYDKLLRWAVMMRAQGLCWLCKVVCLACQHLQLQAVLRVSFVSRCVIDLLSKRCAVVGNAACKHALSANAWPVQCLNHQNCQVLKQHTPIHTSGDEDPSLGSGIRAAKFSSSVRFRYLCPLADSHDSAIAHLLMSLPLLSCRLVLYRAHLDLCNIPFGALLQTLPPLLPCRSRAMTQCMARAQ